MREDSFPPRPLIISPERSNSPAPIDSPVSAVLSPRDSARYLEYQRGLISIHRSTGVLPTVKILNGEIIKIGDLPVAGGVYSDIWLGKWLAEEKVYMGL